MEECAGEEELNDQLNVFAENYAYVYGGRNDIKTQIGFDSLDGKCCGGLSVCHSRSHSFKKILIPSRATPIAWCCGLNL